MRKRVPVRIVLSADLYNGRQIPILTASSKAMFDIKSLGNKSFTAFGKSHNGVLRAVVVRIPLRNGSNNGCEVIRISAV